jgi:hypothetical protein
MTWKTIAAALVTAAALAGCGGPLKYAVKGTEKAPEVDAQIVADVNRDAAMTSIKVNAEHLAPPDRLASGGKVFVVWTKGDKPKWHRVGALKYEEGSRKGSIEGASVPVTAFDLQITVEKDPAPDGPSSDVVLKQHVN